MFDRTIRLAKGSFLGMGLILTVSCADINPYVQSNQITSIYIPQGQSDLNIDDNNSSFDTGFKSIEQKLNKGYVKTEKRNGKKHLEEHLSADIKISLGFDDNGFEQPVFFFHDGNSTQEKLYFSNIEQVQGVEIEDENGTRSKRILFSYRELMDKEGKLPYSKITFFDLGVNDGMEGVVEALATLSSQYRKAKAGIIKREKEKSYCSIPFLSPTEQAAICNGASLESKQVELIGKVSFDDDCIYNPSHPSSKGIEELINNLTNKNFEGVLLVCGNATKPSAVKCQPEIKDYGNGQLSWDRSFYLVEYINRRLGEKAKNLQTIIYPNGTKLDERSARVYLVKEQT